MFRSLSRRLALLNALVVIAVIAAVGLASYLYLERKVETQADAELRTRSSSAVQLWNDVYLAANISAMDPSASPESSSPSDGRGEDEEDDHEDDELEELAEHESRELVRSGDTIAYAVDLDGETVSSLRDVEVDGLPKQDSISRALAGSIVVETISVDHDRVRLRSEPVLVDGNIIGAIQVGMGLGPNERVLEFLRMATIGGLLLGVALAIPSGWYLANRSMRPIRDAFARQQAFVANASHELRTPLTLIRAEAEYLQQSPDIPESERREGESAIIRETDAMAGLITGLLQLAKFDEAQLQLQTEAVDLVQAAKTAHQRFATLAADRGISFELDDRIRVSAIADRQAIDQILTILIDNAMAFTPTGGRVTLRTSQRLGHARIEVEDSGVGIDPALQDRIFDRFYRADLSRTRSGGGAGLGLSIARELAQAQRGTIEVKSAIETGSTFTLSLPSA